VQRALGLLVAGVLLAVWLFLFLTTPLTAVILMLAAVAWRDARRRRPAVASPASHERFLPFVR
jgi:multisubunit Na+/H+ antiporter MnhG subunit